ncbi:DUF4405 domain-containing protein [Gluconacetobacter takamatsuzukensis]|nr:DUF4405 domain-containing protein [Gluconacetobacter takamatsuzukensis]
MSADSSAPSGPAVSVRPRRPFTVFMNRYGTPLTTGFFLVSTVTGVALFFHWGPGAFHPMHEWLSMVLLVPFVLHMVKNWNSLLNYARRGWLYVPLLIALLASAYFFLAPSTGGKGGNRQLAFRVVSLVTSAPLGQIAPLFGIDADEALRRLHAQNLQVTSDSQAIDAIALANSRTTNDVLAALMRAPGGEQAHAQRHVQLDPEH